MSAMIHAHELIVDLFAGGGGASTGIEAALGRDVDIAVNHSPAAIAMHRENHPRTRHYCESVWDVDPREACGGRRVGLLHASPDCTHFSRAKGKKPRDQRVRSLASVVTRWAREVKPRVIVLENVREFLDWGPLDEHGQPIKALAGTSFREWFDGICAEGYEGEYRLLNAANFRAPTIRERLFIVFRCDGQPIAWPAPTHGRSAGKPWVPASTVIDWDIAAPSIFGRKRPLAEATQRRIAAGVHRYVINAATPFIVPVRSHGGGGNDARSTEQPLRTVTCTKRGEFALVSPSLVQTGYGEREGQAPRALDIAKPLGTVVSGGKHALVAAMLTKHYGGVVGHGVQLPLGTITTQDHHALTTATLAPAAVDRREEVRGFLVKYYSSSGRPESQQQGLFEPLHTVTTKDRFGLVTVHGQPYEIADIGMRMLSPRELFRAQSFSDSYVIDPLLDGKRLTKTQQIALAGNSVCPVVEEAVVGALFRAPSQLQAAS